MDGSIYGFPCPRCGARSLVRLTDAPLRDDDVGEDVVVRWHVHRMVRCPSCKRRPLGAVAALAMAVSIMGSLIGGLAAGLGLWAGLSRTAIVLVGAAAVALAVLAELDTWRRTGAPRVQ